MAEEGEKPEAPEEVLAVEEEVEESATTAEAETPEETPEEETPEEATPVGDTPDAETPVAKGTEDPNKPVKEDNYEIRINSYKVVSAAGVVAVHNEVAFYRNGEPLLALNGNAHNNQTGELNTFAINQGSTLRVSGGDITYGQGTKPMQLVGSVTLASNLTTQEMLDKVKTALAASQYINDNKIEYVVIGGLTYEGQNSNSVATTLISAMGYQYPQNEFSGLWAPGAKRNLLPDGWTHNLTNDDLANALTALERANVNQKVRDEKIPVHRPEAGEPNFPNLHEPNKAAQKIARQFDDVNVALVNDLTVIPLNNTASASKENSGSIMKSTGFKSSMDAGIKVDQNLTGSFAEVADGAPKRPEPAQELPGVVISKGQPSQNQDSYAAAPEVARR